MFIYSTGYQVSGGGPNENIRRCKIEIFDSQPQSPRKGRPKISGICPISRQREHQFCHQSPNEVLSNANLSDAFELLWAPACKRACPVSMQLNYRRADKTTSDTGVHFYRVFFFFTGTPLKVQVQKS